MPTTPTPEQVVRALARLRRGDGKPLYSANKIESLVGGTRADVLAWVREERASGPPPRYFPLDENRQRVLEDVDLPIH
jgi:hypothetical protein